MSHLKWLVVRDLNMIESATFWKDGPEIETGELRTEDIGTEVFFMPAASHAEKDGTFTNTQRVLQWHHKAVEPPNDCRSELQFFFELGGKLRERVRGSVEPRDRPLLDLVWDYPVDEHGDPSADAVLLEINGRHLSGDKAGQPLNSYLEMADDGSTSGGCWIYTGVYADGINQAARRKPASEQSWVAPEWGWAWPANRRILYNRASADPDGKPWSERKAYVWWDENEQKWTGHDIPDFEPTKPPSYRPEPGTGGIAGLSGDDPFIMQADGKGWLFAPAGLLDGPLPAHYEPSESPVRNPFYQQQANPTRQVFPRKDNLQNPSPPEPASDVFPFVFTTYRLTEHHTAGGMSRWLPFLSELQPEFFCEISPELARLRGLEHLGWATIVTARTAIEARVLVTDRMVPLTVDGRTIHQVGLPYHWGVGSSALVSGDSANDLFGVTLDPNVHIQESKVASCDIHRGAGRRGRRCCASSRSTAAGQALPSRPATPSALRGHEWGSYPGRIRTSRRAPAGRTPRRVKGSSPTRRSASAARRARWRARNGTASPTTGSTCSVRPMTTPARSARRPGGTWRSSSSRSAPAPRNRASAIVRSVRPRAMNSTVPPTKPSAVIATLSVPTRPRCRSASRRLGYQAPTTPTSARSSAG